MTVCIDCGRPIRLVAGRWVHLGPSRVGLGPRPTFVACDISGRSVADAAVDTAVATVPSLGSVSTASPVPGSSPVHPPGGSGTDPV